MVTNAIDTIQVPLFVPADRPDRFVKAAASGADAIILDLEDAVAPGDKAAARANLTGVDRSIPVIVRINGVDTEWHKADLAAIRILIPSAVMLPKAEPGPDLAAAARALSPIPVIALVETARGLAGARAIAAAPGMARLAFGSIDYCANLDCAHDPEILLPARSELVLASRLAGLPAPLDGVTADTRDLSVTAADAARARALGMGGKLVIHPRQVAPVKNAFFPAAEQIDWARRVQEAPQGVSTIDGVMVDAPVRARARQILVRAGALQATN